MAEDTGRKIKKRAWNSYFTGGFGKRSLGGEVAGGGGLRLVAGGGGLRRVAGGGGLRLVAGGGGLRLVAGRGGLRLVAGDGCGAEISFVA